MSFFFYPNFSAFRAQISSFPLVELSRCAACGEAGLLGMAAWLECYDVGGLWTTPKPHNVLFTHKLPSPHPPERSTVLRWITSTLMIPCASMRSCWLYAMAVCGPGIATTAPCGLSTNTLEWMPPRTLCVTALPPTALRRARACIPCTHCSGMLRSTPHGLSTAPPAPDSCFLIRPRTSALVPDLRMKSTLTPLFKARFFPGPEKAVMPWARKLKNLNTRAHPASIRMRKSRGRKSLPSCPPVPHAPFGVQTRI